MTKLSDDAGRTEVLNRLRRAEGQIRGVQRMIEEGESCLKIGQQFSASFDAPRSPCTPVFVDLAKLLRYSRPWHVAC